MVDRSKSRVIGKLALGTAQFGSFYGISNSKGQTTSNEAFQILTLAEQQGIEVLDTALLYGTSEEVLGSLGSTIASFKIISKYPKLEPGQRVSECLTKSMARLGVENLYAFLAHSPDSLTQVEWEELGSQKEMGLIRKIGYSLYNPEQLERLLDQGMIPDLVQIPFNVLDRRFESWLGVLQNLQVEVHTRSAFLQGLLLMDPQSLSPYFEPVRPFLESIRTNFYSTAELAGALLFFCANNPAIDKVVIGVNDVVQLDSNITSLGAASPMNWNPFELVNEDILLPYHWPKQ